MPLPDDLLTENVSDTDNADTIVRLAVSVAKRAADHALTESYAPYSRDLDISLGVKCAEIAERLGRTALYVATVERPTKIDDSGQSDDPDGPDDPDDPDTPYDYDGDIKPNGKAVDGIGYSEP